MPVSFKVPSSPRRDIFAIDKFLGVDLTNSGTNIDPVRSPNAENMVRLVPGKVRKRTGYKTEIQFHSTDDINRAINTSDEWENILALGENEEIILVYDSVLPLVGGDCLYAIYMDVDAYGFYTVYIDFETGSSLSVTIDGERSDNPISFLTLPEAPDTDRSGLYRIRIVRDSYRTGQYFKIKSVRICTTTEAATEDEWKALPWSAAPEDIESKWIKLEQSYPVFGCHQMTPVSGITNRVVNVNRVLDTSDDWETFSVTNDLLDIYDLAEQFYLGYEEGKYTPVNIEFDYISTESVYMYFYTASGDMAVFVLASSEGNVKHYSNPFNFGSYKPYKIALKQREGNTSIQIRKMSVMYQMDSEYVWSAAPEDSDDVFHIEDLYNVSETNTAKKEKQSGSANRSKTSSIEKTLRIQSNPAHTTPEGFVKISFDAYTTCTEDITSIEVFLEDRNNNRCDITSKVFDDNLHNHIEFFGSSDCTNQVNNYIKSVVVKFNFTYTEDRVKTYTSLTNIKVQKITLKDDYDLSSKFYIYHVGKEFYLKKKASDTITKIYDSANTHISHAWQMNDKLILIDGKHIYRYTSGQQTIETLDSGGYIPLITIGKAPTGGGTSYEPINMLQPGFYEQFTVDSESATAKTFYLSFGQLDNTEVQAWILNSSGEWVLKVEGTDFSVNRSTGRVTFTTAPGESPVSGEDNVRILAYKTIVGYADRVIKCTIGTLYGVNGAMDRLFLSGNPEYPNWDFFSQQNDPTYFPDTGYSVIGNAASAIVGYAIVNNYLATFKNKIGDTPAVFIRQGEFIENSITGVAEPVFRLTNTLMGEGIVSPYAFGNMPTEPLFLTRLGIYAITPQDITGEKYSQKRSFYLDGALTKEKNLEEAKAVIFKDQYILAVNNKLYILDGLQATRTDASEPYATRQYAGFFCTNVPAYIMWVDEDALWIGTEDGRISRFETRIDRLESYNDDKRKIYCCWETPDLDGKLFYKNKTFKYFAIRIRGGAEITSVRLYSEKLDVWKFIKEAILSAFAFDFEDVNFTNLYFGKETPDKVIHTKIRLKKVDKARFRVENNKLNEPLGLLDLALEYVEKGNYKG